MAQRCPICRGPHTLLKGSPVRVLGGTSRALGRIVGARRRRLLTRRPAPREWSATEVLAHIADVELASGFRIRKIASEPRPALNAFDQEAWAKAFRYSRQDPRELLETFRALRDANLRILRSLTSAQRRRVGVHAEAGPIRLDQLIAHLADHDLNHLNQLRTVIRSLSARR